MLSCHPEWSEGSCEDSSHVENSDDRGTERDPFGKLRMTSLMCTVMLSEAKDHVKV